MAASAITGRRLLATYCLASTALLAAGCASTGTPTPTRTVTVTATATPPGSPSSPGSPTSAPPPTASGPLPCSTSALRLAAGSGDGAAGTIYYSLRFTNASASACTVYGYPGAAFVRSPGGSQVGAPARRNGVVPALVTLAPGATAHALLAVSNVLLSNNCTRRVQVHWVQVYPPDQYTPLFAPITSQGCADKSLVIMSVSPVASGP